MFAQEPKADVATTTTETNTSETTTEGPFPGRIQSREDYWAGIDLKRIVGASVLRSDKVRAKEKDGSTMTADRNRSPLLREYDLVMEISKDLSKAFRSDKSDNLPGLREYRNQFPEPDADMWRDFFARTFGDSFKLTGIHKVPQDVAMNTYGIDYTKDKQDPIYLPEFEGMGVYQVPPELEESEAVEETESEPEPESSGKPANAGDKAAQYKKDHPHLSNDDVGAKFNISGTAVANACKRNFGEEGYEAIKAEGREARQTEGGFEFVESEPETESADLPFTADQLEKAKALAGGNLDAALDLLIALQ
ncbi:hypothetical protein [Halorubellus litoreus]|uniref:Uncharacterized protein n=1 Tax=Halorubellus litoreus TaxID=755308 RepID=A0ABD5VKN4_9EURY